jgi:hypothetical protein
MIEAGKQNETLSMHLRYTFAPMGSRLSRDLPAATMIDNPTQCEQHGKDADE